MFVSKLLLILKILLVNWKLHGLQFCRGSNFSIFLLIFEWDLEQCSSVWSFWHYAIYRISNFGVMTDCETLSRVMSNVVDKIIIWNDTNDKHQCVKSVVA